MHDPHHHFLWPGVKNKTSFHCTPSRPSFWFCFWPTPWRACQCVKMLVLASNRHAAKVSNDTAMTSAGKGQAGEWMSMGGRKLWLYPELLAGFRWQYRANVRHRAATQSTENAERRTEKVELKTEVKKSKTPETRTQRAADGREWSERSAERREHHFYRSHS